MEFASIYRSFDCEVTILEMLPRLVPIEDEEVSKELLKAFNKRGIKSQLGVKVQTVEKTKDGIKVAFTDSEGKSQTIEAEKILIAIGRAPRDLEIPEGCSLFAVVREGRAVPLRPDTILAEGDKVIAIGRAECEAALHGQLIGNAEPVG